MIGKNFVFRAIKNMIFNYLGYRSNDSQNSKAKDNTMNGNQNKKSKSSYFQGITINGNSLNISGSYSSIRVDNGGIFIDGKQVDPETYKGKLNVDLVVNGDVENVDTVGRVEVKGAVKGNINTTGSVDCGNVGGDIDTTGSVTVSGNVAGDIDTVGPVRVGSN